MPDADTVARLVDYAEASRTDDWSLRSALVRYAQPEPTRASAVLELVRRTDAALHPHVRALEADGRAFDLARTPDDPAAETLDDELRALLPVLDVVHDLDALADVLTDWAVDPSQPRPDDDVDERCRTIFAKLESAGVPREQQGPPPRRQRRST